MDSLCTFTEPVRHLEATGKRTEFLVKLDVHTKSSFDNHLYNPHNAYDKFMPNLSDHNFNFKVRFKP